MTRQNIYLLSILTIMIISISVIGATSYFLEPNQSPLHNRQDSKIHDTIKKLPKSTNPNPLIYKVMSEDVQILYVYDPNSDVPVYKDEYMSIFNQYDLNVTPVLRADLDSFVRSNNSYSLIILGPSVGGIKGDAITYSDARQIFSYHTPLLLLGSSHGLIDRLENIESSNVTRGTVVSVNVTNAFISHQITSKPYFVDLSKSLIEQAEVIDYYNFTNPSIEPILQGDASEIIGGYYHSNLLKKTIWLGFENGSNLSSSGEAFLINTIIWLSYKSRLSVLADYIASLQILSNPLFIGYGGFGYTSSPLVSDTYYYVSILELLNSENEIDINKTINFLLRCYNLTDGSFVDLGTETDSSISKVWSTGLAVYILNVFNKTDVINTTKTANFLASSQDISGGFKNSPYADSDTINIRNTFAALYGLSILDPNFSLINKTTAKNYILSLQVTDMFSQDYGGFKDSSTSYQASVYATFYAIRSLELLSEKNSVDLSAVSIFINKNEQTGGSFTDKIGYTPPKATAVAVWLLFDIGRLDTLDNFTNTLNYIKSMQNPDGGFGLYIGDSFSELKDTYFAILGLSSIGHEPDDMAGLHNFLSSTNSIDGGNSKTRLWSSVWTTFDALDIINLTDSLHRINQTALEIYLNSSYQGDKGYFYWTPNRGGFYSPPPELNYLLIPTRGIPMTYFAINAIELANLTDLKNDIVGDVSSTLISSEIVDNTSQFYGMYSYIPYTSTSLINTWNTRYEFVFWAVESLGLLGNLSDTINPLATREYLNACYTEASSSYPEARFLYTLPYPYKNSYELSSTYFALSTLNNLDGINESILMSARDIVNNNLNYSDILSVFYAMKIKNILKQYNSTLSDSIFLNRTAILELLRKNQLNVGIFKGDLWSGYWLEYTRMALDLIKELHLTLQFDETLFIDANVTLYPDKNQYLLGGALTINVTSSISPLQRNETRNLQVYLNNTLLLNQTFYEAINVTTSFDNSSFLGHNTLIIRISAEDDDIIPYEFTKQITIITELNITSTLDKTYYYNYEVANITVIVNSSLGILVDDAIVTANFSGVVNNTYTLSSIGNGTYTSLISLLEYEGTTYITIYAHKPFAIPDNETRSIFVFNTTTSTSVTCNSTELSWGDTLELKIKVTNDMELVNGTALILLDGQSLDNSTVVNGNSTYVYVIPNNTPLGQHNITVTFGLYDDPDKYNVSQDCVLFNVTLQPNINAQLSNDTIYATEEMKLTAEVTYNNVPVDVWIYLEIVDSSTNDIKYNTISYGASFLFIWKPDSAGNYTIVLSVVENETIKSSTVNLSLTVLKTPTSIIINSSNDFELSSGIVFNATFLALNHVDSAPILIYANNTLVNILTVSNSTEIKILVDNVGVYNIT
ncbi:MAG: terpene cyclase/mutase family protein, partial [Candidatus Odinarchaeota archaeon]|nr:terpene cyclase/mutase family protein [Candidatus Odinarchaeota archaeon]